MKVFFYRISGVPQRNARSGRRFRKYPKTDPLGSIHSKNPVGSGETNAYFVPPRREAVWASAPGTGVRLGQLISVTRHQERV